jgi:hypothetical protein
MLTVVSTVDRYEAKVDRSGGPFACHPWTGAHSHDGYGMFIHDGENYATRWGYRHFVGELAPGEIVRHSCDNPPCQNQRHWVKGSHQDNSDDKVSRHRQHHPTGERNPKARLTEQAVVEIRRRMAAIPGMTRQLLADEFGVSPITIRDVVRRRTWRHLP